MDESSDAKRGSAAVGLLRGALYLGLIAAIGVVAYSGYCALQERSALRKGEDELVSTHGLETRTVKHLAPEYTDNEGRLLADPPTDPKKWLDPETLVLAHYEEADVDSQPVDWDGFVKFLGQATGKKIAAREYVNSAEDVANVKTGEIQVVGLHAADTPYLVNNAGFIPVAVVGNETAANGNRLDVAVRTNSSVKSLADIKGHTLVCTAPDSITGYRAAVAVLSQDVGLRPDVDYYINFSLSQKKSVLGVASGEYEVAALSDEKAQSMLKKGSVKSSDYRVVYQSQVIPRLTIGYVYNLKPELAAKIKQAILDFKNDEGAIEESSGKPMHFMPVDYKKDFEFVRRMDDSFDPRFSKAKSKHEPGN